MPVFIENIDLSILRAIDSLDVPFLNWIAQALSLLCEHGLVPIVLTLALLAFKKTRRAGVVMAVAMVFSLLFTNLLIKPLAARPRPYVKYDISVSAILPHDLSFPSGHASIGFSAAVAFAASSWDRYRKCSIAAVVVAALVGLSRIWLKVHYPSDVVVGALLGAAYAFAACFIVKFAAEKLAKRRK